MEAIYIVLGIAAVVGVILSPFIYQSWGNAIDNRTAASTAARRQNSVLEGQAMQNLNAISARTSINTANSIEELAKQAAESRDDLDVANAKAKNALKAAGVKVD